MPIVRVCLSIIIFACLSLSGFTQVDSLKNLAATLAVGEEKVEIWIDLIYELMYVAPDQALIYCDSLLVVGNELKNPRLLGIAQYSRATIDNNFGENLIALDKLKKAKTHFEAANDQTNLANTYNLEGVVLTSLNLLDQAATSYLKSIEIADQSNDLEMKELGYHNLGNLFIDLENFTKAEQYLRKALEIKEELEDFSCHSSIYSSLGICKGGLSLKKKELAYYQKAYNFAEQSGNQEDLIIALSNIGSYYYINNEYSKAKKTLLASIAIQESDEIYTYDLANVYSHLAGIAFEEGQVDSLFFYGHLALNLAKQSEDLFVQYEIYELFADYYAKNNQGDSASIQLKKVIEIKDSLYQEDVQRQVQINADQFQLERKEKQLAEQELQLAQAANNRNRLIMFGILLLAIIAATYQWYLARQRRRKQLAEFALAQQQAEADRLRQLDQAKSNFFTNISHELRTPLSLILGPLSDVLREVKAIPIKDKLHTIQRNGRKLLDLVNEIMDLSTLEAGKLALQSTNVELIPYVKRIWGSFESLAVTRRIKMHLDIAVEEVNVLLDRDKFEKILNNLLSNAIKFTPADGFIRLRVSKKAGLYHFEVKDTGSGIADDDQQKIFDRFFQAEHGKAQQGGTGVGLALAKKLAKLMDGDIQVNSALKEGSTFTFSLTLTETDTKTTAKETVKEEEQTAPIVFSPLSIQGQKPKVLVVEDHPEMGKYLIQSLGERYDCILATDGLQALHHLKIHQFDAITSDVMMPNMDGFELRKKINENPVWKHIPFLLLTARHLESDKIKGFQLGVDDYVTKPFSHLELQARLHNLISNKIERDKFMAAEFNAVDQNPTENVDQKFLKEIETEILRNLDREQYSVEDLAKAIGYSSKQLSRILKKLTGLTTVNFILEVRLQKARTLLENRLVATVSEAQYEVGISSTSYFTRKFTERFGKNPRDLL